MLHPPCCGGGGRRHPPLVVVCGALPSLSLSTRIIVMPQLLLFLLLWIPVLLFCFVVCLFPKQFFFLFRYFPSSSVTASLCFLFPNFPFLNCLLERPLYKRVALVVPNCYFVHTFHMFLSLLFCLLSSLFIVLVIFYHDQECAKRFVWKRSS